MYASTSIPCAASWSRIPPIPAVSEVRPDEATGWPRSDLPPLDPGDKPPRPGRDGMKTGVRRVRCRGNPYDDSRSFTPSPDLARPGRRRDDGRRLHIDSGADALGIATKPGTNAAASIPGALRSWVASSEWVGTWSRLASSGRPQPAQAVRGDLRGVPTERARARVGSSLSERVPGIDYEQNYEVAVRSLRRCAHPQRARAGDPTGVDEVTSTRSANQKVGQLARLGCPAEKQDQPSSRTRR